MSTIKGIDCSMNRPGPGQGGPFFLVQPQVTQAPGSVLFDAVPNVRDYLMQERFQRQAQVYVSSLVLYLCL